MKTITIELPDNVYQAWQETANTLQRDTRELISEKLTFMAIQPGGLNDALAVVEKMNDEG